MTIEQKPWGTTELLHFNGVSQVNRILVLEGGYSSRHFHGQKANVFVVLRGELLVTTYVPDAPGHVSFVPQTRHVLHAGDTCTIAPCVVHKFLATEATEAIEAYYATGQGEVRLDDIVRLDANGIAPPENADDPRDRG